jgi:hypothetical protein
MTARSRQRGQRHRISGGGPPRKRRYSACPQLRRTKRSRAAATKRRRISVVNVTALVTADKDDLDELSDRSPTISWKT